MVKEYYRLKQRANNQPIEEKSEHDQVQLLWRSFTQQQQVIEFLNQPAHVCVHLSFDRPDLSLLETALNLPFKTIVYHLCG